MSKYLCCGMSKNNNIGLENNEFQLLLLGPNQSSKFIILKQIAKIQNQFTEQQRINRIPLIKDHIRRSIINILQVRNDISIHSDLEYPENEWRIENILNMTQQIHFNYSLTFFENVLIIWMDQTIRSYLTYFISDKMIDSIKYFLDRIDQIKEMDYIPTDQDMIHSYRMMSQICEMSFKTLNLQFRLIEFDFLQSSSRKWIHYFSNINGILFMADCSNLDGILQSLNQFNDIVNKNNHYLNDKPVVLLLHNQYLLANQIEMNIQDEELISFLKYLLVFEKSINIDPFENYTYSQLKSIVQNTFIMKFNACNRSDHPLYIYETSNGNINIVNIISDVWPTIIRQNNAFGYRT